MSAHTPGPWRLAELIGDNVRTQKVRLIRPADDRNYELGAVCYVYGDDSVMTKANARLISEAPNLLNELELLIAVYGDDIEQYPDGAKHLANARAVIEKAGGRNDVQQPT